MVCRGNETPPRLNLPSLPPSSASAPVGVYPSRVHRIYAMDFSTFPIYRSSENSGFGREFLKEPARGCLLLRNRWREPIG